MGKFLGALIEAIGAGIAFIIGGPVGLAIGISLAVSAGLSVLTTLLTPSAPKPGTTDQPLKTSRPPRVSAYGRSRLYGTYILYETASNGSAVDAYAVHDGKMDGVELYYLNDEQVTLSGATVNRGTDGRYRDGAVSLYHTDGSSPGAGIPDLGVLGSAVWGTDHRGDGVVLLALVAKAVKAKVFQETFPSSAVPTPSLVARWQLCPDPAASDPLDESGWTWTENPVRQTLHYEIVRKGPRPPMDEDAPGYAAALLTLRQAWWARKIAPTLSYWIAAAAVCDETVPLLGMQTALLADANHGATSITVTSTTGLAVGMSINIAQEDNTSITEARTVTAITGTTISFSGGLSHDHTAGSGVTWASDAGSPAAEPRYRSLVSHNHTDKHEGVQSNLMATFDGWTCPRADGAIMIYAGKFYPPDPVLDLIGPDEIVSYSWNGGAVDDDSAINELVLNYVSSAHDYNSVECDAWRDEADIARRGQVLSDTLDLRVPSHSQARRIAKRVMQKRLAADRGTVTTNLAGRSARGKRYVYLRLLEAGALFYEGPVEIIALTRASQGGVSFDWVAADPNVDLWDPASEEGLPAAVGDRVAAAALEAPAISSFTVVFDATGARVNLTVDAPARDDLTWYVHWRVLGSGVWGPDEQSTDTDPGPAVDLVTGYVASGEEIEIQVAYQVGDGRFSDWSDAQEIDTDAAAVGPDPATMLTVTPAAGSAVVAWRNPSSSNFGYVRVYRGTSASFASAAQVGANVVGGLGQLQQITDTVAAGSYNWWVRAFSTAGVASAPTGPQSGTVT